jgi:Repeat of Unknown Function (DUF347)
VLIFGGLIAVTWLAYRFGAGQVLTFWIAYVLTRPLGASLGDLLTQDKQFGGLALGASVTSLLFFAAILLLVIREQVLVNRHGVAAKGAGPIGGRQRDYAWAAAAIVAVTVAGFALSTLHPATDPAGATQAASDQDAGAAQQPGTGKATGPAARRVHPTTRLGNLSSFAVIVTDVKAKVAKNDLAGAKARVKDLEVAWDDAEAGLKPRDSGKWHQLDDQIDAVLTALRASHPTQADCASTVATLATTLNKFDGV